MNQQPQPAQENKMGVMPVHRLLLTMSGPMMLSMLIQALYNLVDNAVKYTPAGGAVTLRAVGYELFCRVDVTDTGPGIPESEQARIFQRFYRSPSASEAEGVGIGLYLARQIAAGQGGYLKVSSRPGEGSTFSLFLPRAEERT